MEPTNNDNDIEIPVIDLGQGLVVYDAFVIRAIHQGPLTQFSKGLRHMMTDGLAYEAVGELLRDNPPTRSRLVDAISRAVWGIFVKEPATPPWKIQRNNDQENIELSRRIWRYVLVPSALVGAGACLDYWSDRFLLDGAGRVKIGGTVTGYGSSNPKALGSEYDLSRVMLASWWGNNEWLSELSQTKSPKRWIRQFQKRDYETHNKLSGMGCSLATPLNKSFVSPDGELHAWTLDFWRRHPEKGAEVVPHQNDQGAVSFVDYGYATCEVYSLMLHLMYSDSTGRLWSSSLPQYIGLW